MYSEDPAFSRASPLPVSCVLAAFCAEASLADQALRLSCACGCGMCRVRGALALLSVCSFVAPPLVPPPHLLHATSTVALAASRAAGLLPCPPVQAFAVEASAPSQSPPTWPAGRAGTCCASAELCPPAGMRSEGGAGWVSSPALCSPRLNGFSLHAHSWLHSGQCKRTHRHALLLALAQLLDDLHTHKVRRDWAFASASMGGLVWAGARCVLLTAGLPAATVMVAAWSTPVVRADCAYGYKTRCARRARLHHRPCCGGSTVS